MDCELEWLIWALELMLTPADPRPDRNRSSSMSQQPAAWRSEAQPSGP
jgi:hypothetical protein